MTEAFFRQERRAVRIQSTAVFQGRSNSGISSMIRPD
jgi:hypothetical protein